MDLNQNCLDAAARQIARYDPVLSLGNALEPFTVEGPMFDSVGLNYLLHCLPGDIRAKSVVFQHAKAAAVPGATIFGAHVAARRRRPELDGPQGDGPEQCARHLLERARRP